MRLAALTSDLLLYSRIEAVATRAGASLRWLTDVGHLPPAAELDLLLVDWAERTASSMAALQGWRAAGGGRMILFGPHTDLEAHAAARAAELGPMWARSRLLRDLEKVISEQA